MKYVIVTVVMGQTKCCMIGSLCFFFILNFTVSNSLPNGKQLENHEQLNHTISGDSELHTIHQVGEDLANVSHELNTIHLKVNGLTAEQIRRAFNSTKQIRQDLKSLNSKLQDLEMRTTNQAGEYSNHITQSVKNILDKLDALNAEIIHQVGDYSEKVTQSDNIINHNLYDLKTILTRDDQYLQTITQSAKSFKDFETMMTNQIGEYSNNIVQSVNGINCTIRDLKDQLIDRIGEYAEKVTQLEINFNRILHDLKTKLGQDFDRKLEHFDTKTNQRVEKYSKSVTQSITNLELRNMQKLDDYSNSISQLVDSLKITIDNLKEELLQKFEEILDGKIATINAGAGGSKPQVPQNVDKAINVKIDNLIKSQTTLNRELDGLKKKLQQQAELQLPDEIVRDIKSYRFSLAAQKLEQTDDGTYTYVVRQVYDNQAGNFDLLLNFADSIPQIASKLKIYSLLYDNSVSSGLDDPRKLLRLRQSLKGNILDEDETTSASLAMQTYKNLKNTIEDTAVGPISSAFQNDNSWSTIKSFSEEFLSTEDFDCALKIYKGVVETVWNKITLDDLLLRARINLKSVDERVAIHSAVIEKLKSTGKLNTNLAMTLAHDVKHLMDSLDGIENIDLPLRTRHQEIKDELPGSVKNLVFLPEICIKSSFDEYLYTCKAASCISSPLYRHVFALNYTGGEDVGLSQFNWTRIFVGPHQIQLRNDHVNEYLISAESTYDNRLRYAFTSKPAYALPTDLWNIEVRDNNYVYLKNNDNGEYLHRAQTKNQNGNYVSTYRSASSTEGDKWQITDCSDIGNSDSSSHTSFNGIDPRIGK